VNNYSIDHIDLSDKEKTECKEIMCDGNSRFIYWHDKIKKEYEKRTGKKHFSRSKFRGQLLNKLSKEGVKEISALGVVIPKEDIEKILKVKSIEVKILQGHSKLMHKLAKRWSSKSNMEFTDTYQEIQIQFLNAIYNFNKKELQFSTFAYHAATRHMISLCSIHKPFSSWGPKVNELYNEFENAKRKFNRHCSREEVYILMNKIRKDNDRSVISEKDKDILEKIGSSLISQSDMKHEENESCNFDNLISTDSVRMGVSLNDLEAKAVKTAGLTPFEKLILKQYLKSDFSKKKSGWATEFALNNINPNTGRNYAKSVPGMVLKQVKEKILERYRELLSEGQEGQKTA
jgi:DNA-directed RNA polymerase specialized sigma subunit